MHTIVRCVQGFMHYVAAGPLRVDVEALNDHMRPAGALRLRHAQVRPTTLNAALDASPFLCSSGISPIQQQ